MHSDQPDGVESSSSARPMTGRRRAAAVVGFVAILALVGGAVMFSVVLWGGSSGRMSSTSEAGRRIRTATSLAAEPQILRPAQGVYLYRGSGTDVLSRPPKEQIQGPDMPATVTHRADGCWTMRIDYHTNHWQSWDYCPRNGGLYEVGGQTYQKWDFGVLVSETTGKFVCESSETIRAGAEPGDEWVQSCRTAPGAEGTPSSTSGPYRFVGTEQLTIGGERIAAFHYHRDREMSGGQRGTERSEVWFAASDGLPLRNERRLEVRTDTIIGETTYTEDANFELVRRP